MTNDRLPRQAQDKPLGAHIFYVVNKNGRLAPQYARFPPAAKAIMQGLESEPWCLSAGISYPQPWMNLADLGAAVRKPPDKTINR
jgi:hypothetical protein